MRISIRQKIFGGYVLFIVVAVMVNLYTIRQLRIISRIATYMEQVELQKIAVIKDMQGIWKQKKRIEIRYLSFREDDKLREYRDKSDQFQRAIDSLLIRTTRNEGLQQVHVIYNLHRQYDSWLDRRINAEKSVNSEEQIKLLDERLAQDHAQMEHELEKHMIIVEQNLASARRRSVEIAQNTTGYVVIMASLILVLGLITASVLAVGITRPLRKLTTTAHEIALGHFKERVETTSRDEVGELAYAFNHMTVQLARLDEIKADFISHASHELRTPVAAIKNAASLFRDITRQELSDDQHKLLNIIAENTSRLTNLINDLLDVARLESDQVRLNFQPTDVVRLAESCLTALEPLAKEKFITLSRQAAGPVSPVEIDGEKIEQVLTNLLSNAIKFTPARGQVTVELEDKGSVLEVRVKDTGIGIPADKINSIFEKFQQVKAQRESPTKGTGLGLTICRHIVEAHQGAIWATSELGKGSTFSFTLPKQRG